MRSLEQTLTPILYSLKAATAESRSEYLKNQLALATVSVLQTLYRRSDTNRAENEIIFQDNKELQIFCEEHRNFLIDIDVRKATLIKDKDNLERILIPVLDELKATIEESDNGYLKNCLIQANKLILEPVHYQSCISKAKLNQLRQEEKVTIEEMRSSIEANGDFLITIDSGDYEDQQKHKKQHF